MTNANILSLKKSLTIWLWILLFTIPAGAQNVGINTTTPLAALHVDLGASLSNGILFSGLDPLGGSFPSLGAGHRLMYYPGRVVFRAGYVDDTQWDNSQVGAFSFAFGYNPIAKGNGSCAIGDAVYAGGTISTAFGNSTSTKGYSSFVMGMYNDPLIIGADENVETPQTPLLMVGNGDGNGTRNNALAVFKNGDVLLRNYSTVLIDPGVKLPPVTGPGTRMMWLAEKSAFRLGTVHNNDWDADSIGTWSTGIGYSTKAKGQFSLAMGLQTTASGRTSTALGFSTKASGENAISMGSVTTARGSNSASLGFMTYAKSYGSVAIGRFNDKIATSDSVLWIPSDPLLILGNGTSEADLHNTMVIYKNGNIISKNPTPINADPGSIPLPASDPGTRMMWLPEKSAFRAGTVDNTNWNADSLGTWSTAFGYSPKAKGPASFAAGFASSATGLTSTAFGYSTKASGENSIAMGSVSIASGPVATAMGFITLASGFSSTAMGANTRAIGVNSTSMGFLTTATGLNTTSMGFKTYAKSYGSVALGRYNDRITSSDSTAWIPADPLLIVGNGTSDASLHNTLVIYKNGNIISKNPTLINSDPGSIPLPLSGPGTRMMWIPEKSALRIGTVQNANWNADSIGTWSASFGYNTKAKGLISLALGNQTSASGTTSTAMGYGTSASGENSIAMGSVSVATGSVATAMGYNTKSQAFASTAMGFGTIANGPYSTSMGSGTIANGSQSTAMGLGTIANASQSSAMGFESRAMGNISNASGLNSIAKGFASTVVGLYNDSILLSNQASISPLTPLFIVGNGDGYGVGQRSNAMMVRKDGHVGIGTNAPITLLHVEAGSSLTKGFLVQGNYDPLASVPDLNGSSRMMFFPGKGAFRAGRVTGEHWNNIKTGLFSVAMGYNTIASGAYSFALGDGSIASSQGSFATGHETQASGINSQAMGYRTQARGYLSNVAGYYNIAKGFASTVIGIYNDSILLTNQGYFDDTTPLFVVGNGIGPEIGERHNAMVVRKDGNVGIGTSAPNTFLHVDVGSNYSDGIIVNGVYNAGATVPNLGAGSRMMYIPGKAAFRAGRVLADQWDNSNTGTHSFAVGYNTKASAQESSALGSNTMATGPQAFASGLSGTASGTASTSMGNSNMAVGDNSVAMGRNCKAMSDYAVAIGYTAFANGSNSFASGFETKANGGTATATGYRTAANSIYSSASGVNTIAKGYATTVVGMYNDSMFLVNQVAPTAAKAPLFIVGNGGVAQRNNALVIYKDGDAEIDGYTRLGDSTATSFVPRIKMKKLTGTSSPTQNTWISIPHGLTKSKILSVDIIMTIPGFVNLPPSYTYHPGYEYHYQIETTSIVVVNSATNSYNCTDRSFTILIVYEE